MGSRILAENLGKRFRQYSADRPMTIMEAALKGFRRSKPGDIFWALRGVCFEVSAGEMLGIIGHNGAGKSTLLQLLGKVAYPNEGRLKMHGRIGALLDLGAGFHGDLTGTENVFVSAIVTGLLRHEVAERFEQIVQFAELEGFIHNPVRTYSTGMMMRLAFSIAVHTDPQILLVDEFLSVGDLAFQTKCLDRITQLKEQGCAIVLVSHDVGQVKRLCDRALWLSEGKVMAYGEPEVVAGQYTSEMLSRSPQYAPSQNAQTTRMGYRLALNENRFGSLEVEITDVRIYPGTQLNAGEPLTIEIEYKRNKNISAANFGLSIAQSDDHNYLEVNTMDMTKSAISLQQTGTLRLSINRIDFAAGDYFISAGIYEHDWRYAYDYHQQVYPISVKSTTVSTGVLAPPMHWEIL